MAVEPTVTFQWCNLCWCGLLMVQSFDEVIHWTQWRFNNAKNRAVSNITSINALGHHARRSYREVMGAMGQRRCLGKKPCRHHRFTSKAFTSIQKKVPAPIKTRDSWVPLAIFDFCIFQGLAAVSYLGAHENGHWIELACVSLTLGGPVAADAPFKLLTSEFCSKVPLTNYSWNVRDQETSFQTWHMFFPNA